MPPEVFPALATPFVSAGARVIASPFQFVADVDTAIRVVSVCSAAGVVLAVQGRRFDERGQLQVITETHTPASNRTTTTTTFKPGAGALLNLTVFAAQGAPLVGQCYVMVQLLRSTGATAIVLGTLLGGYVTSTQALGFPGSPVMSSTEGEPVSRAILGTTPAAGAEWIETVPTGARWELLSVFYGFTADATIAQRISDLVLRSSATNFLRLLSNASIAAAETWAISWAPNLPSIIYAGLFAAAASLPQRPILRAGDTFGSVTTGIQAGDQYTAPRYILREWLEVG